MWCKRCGKYTRILKHVRRKIGKTPCANPSGPILTQEGHNMAETRLDRMEKEMNLKYNKGNHSLQWNRKLGKQIGAADEGWILCLKCNRRWRWKDRVCNLSRTVCVDKGQVKFAKRIISKRPLSSLGASSIPRHEPASSSSRVGVG